jgi:hypothetical protein
MQASASYLREEAWIPVRSSEAEKELRYRCLLRFAAADAVHFRMRQFGPRLGQVVLANDVIPFLDIGGGRKPRHDQELQSKIVIMLCPARAVFHFLAHSLERESRGFNVINNL